MSGSGFSNPIVGGGGALVYPQIKSPNFNIANPAASPSPSWAILKNGLAYFFGLVLAGGTITGPDYIINTAGIFIYSGTPATGNLIGSWAGVSGTDAFGNLYPAGFNITTGSISGSTFSGTDFIINSAGIFIYSGPPSGPTGGSLTEMPVTPEVVTAAAGIATSTHAFSPAAGSLTVVEVAWLFASNIGATVTCKDSLGNTYTAGPQVQDSFNTGISAVFTHVYPVAPGPVTVKVTCSNTGTAHAVLAPRVLTGQAASQAGAATVAAAGASSVNVQKTITTTVAGSLVYLAAQATAVETLTAITGTTTILLDPDALVGATGATGRTTAATVTPGATVIGWTSTAANSFGFAALEVLPAAGAGNLIGSWAGAAGTDAFGNPYPQGLSVNIGAITGTAITGSSFSGTNFVLNANGLFMYSGTPALGNLIVSDANAGGTDPFGNAYKIGVATYGPSSSYVQLAANGIPAVIFSPQGVTHLTLPTQLISGASNTGAVNEIAQLAVSSGKESGNADAALQLVSAPADASALALAYFGFGGNSEVFIAPGFGIRAVQPGTANTIEGWHTITLDAGWSTVAGFAAPQYRMLPTGDIEFAGAASHASFTINQNLNGSNPLPAGYRPTNQHVFRTGNGGTVADSNYLSTGVIQGLGQASGSVRIYLDGICPLI